MHGTRAIAVLLLTAILLGSPLAQAQGSTTIKNPNVSTPTTLYFHIFDVFNKFLINTQPMDAEFFDVGGTNFPSMSGTPINDQYGGDFDFNTIYGYSTAGPVEYDFNENGRPRFHPERGIAAPVQVDPSVKPVVRLFLEVRDAFGTDLFPNYMPDFTFRILVQEGDDPSVGAKLDAGADLMLGSVTVDLATAGTDFSDGALPSGNELFATAGTGPTGNPIIVPDENGIVELAIELDVLQSVIPKDQAFNIRIDWYQKDPAGQADDDQYAEPFFRFYADPEHLSRMDLNVLNPVYLSFIHPQVAANTLLIHAGGNSPWGTYDLDLANTTLTIEETTSPKTVRKVLSSNEHVHGLHDKDAQFTYLWEFREENAPDGEYTIKLSVTNDRQNAVASGEAKFIIEGDKATGIDTEGEVVEPSGEDEVDTPSVGLLPVLALVAAALLLARRRWNE